MPALNDAVMQAIR